MTFRFSAHDGQGLACEACITLVVAQRATVEACIDGKHDALRSPAEPVTLKAVESRPKQRT